MGLSSHDDDRPEATTRPCWLDVDLDAVGANVRAIRALVAPSQVCAVVKADAYGLGAVAVARAALAAGADRLAVARVTEGVELRRAGLTGPILLIAGFAPTEAAEIVRYDLTPTVAQVIDALALGRAAGRAAVVLPVHLKVDTGLTRLGATPAEALNLARLLQTLTSLRLEGLYTHFASADEADLGFTHAQLGRFQAVHQAMLREGIAPAFLHAANSAGALAAPAARLDLVRLGITMSGHYPSVHVPRTVLLRPAVSLRARLLRVYDVPAGTSVGYGCAFRATHPFRAGLVPVGYADGVPRAHGGRASALVRGVRAPLVGRVSMDQCVLDITNVPDAVIGDVVTLFGSSDGAEIGLDEFAAWSDTISHEALCRIGARVPRRYHERGGSWFPGATAGADPTPAPPATTRA